MTQNIFQAAVYAKLTGDATLMSKITGVYDHPTPDARPPYITIEVKSRDASVMQSDAWEHELTLHVWSTARGAKEAQDIMDRLRDLLHHGTLTLSSGTLSGIVQEDAYVLLDPDGLTRHGICRFRAHEVE